MLGQFDVYRSEVSKGRSLYEGDVICDGIPTTVATIKAGGSGNNGTLVCFSGGQGRDYWSASDAAKNILRNLRKKGYKTVEVRWVDGWLMGGSMNGPKKLACRPATIINWVKNNLHTGGNFCVTGNSGGAGGIAYALSFYEIKPDLTVLSGGPVFSILDQGCSQTGPYGYDRDGAVRTIDMSYGFIGPEERNSGPCILQNNSILSADSIISDGGNYMQDNVHFVFGADDDASNINQGTAYYSAVIDAESTRISRLVVNGVGHTVQSFPDGAKAIYDRIINN